MPLRASSVLGVVLAGGRSTRMGRDKASLPHPKGGTYLDHAIQRFIEAGHPVAVSGREVVGSIPSIGDRVPSSGPAVALWSSMEFAKSYRVYNAKLTAVFIVPVDMPHLETAHLKHILEQAAEDRPTCAIHDASTIHPLVGVYPLLLSDQIRQLAQSEHRSLRHWLALQPHKAVVLPAEAMQDVNYPDDHVRLC